MVIMLWVGVGGGIGVGFVMFVKVNLLLGIDFVIEVF